VPLPVDVDAGHPYQRGQTGRTVLLTPVKDVRSLELLFPLPVSPVPDFGHASRLLSHSLGYEGSGSLLAALKARGWASSLSAGASSLRQCTTLSVSISLTPDGVAHVNDVVRLVLQYGQVMRNAGDGEWSSVHVDVRQQAENALRFKPTTEPVSAVTSLATELVQYPPLHALTGGTLLPVSPDLPALRDLIACLAPSNMVLMLSIQGYDGAGAGLDVTPAVEPYYGFAYGLAPFSAAQRTAWGMPLTDSPAREPASPPASRDKWTHLPSGALFPGSVDLSLPNLPPSHDLTLPPRNPFIPTDFTLLPLPSPTPALPELSAEGAETEAAAGVAALAATAHGVVQIDAVVEEAASPAVAAAAPIVCECGEGAAATPLPLCTLEANPWDGMPASSPVAVAVSHAYASTPLPFPALFPVPALLTGLQEGQRAWWAQDGTFRIPKTYVDVWLPLPSHKAPTGDAARVVTSALVTSLIAEVLNEGVYDAECAGLRWGLQTDSMGGAFVHVYASGYSHTLPTLLAMVLTRAAAVADEPDAVLAPAFDRLKDDVMRGLDNFNKAQPHSRAREAVSAYLTAPYVGREEALEAARGITLAGVREYARGLVSDGGMGDGAVEPTEPPGAFPPAAIELIVSANTDEGDARGWMQVVRTALPPTPPAPFLSPPRPFPTRVALLTPASQVEVTRMHPNPAERNAAVDILWQLGPSTPRVRALASLLAQAWAQPAFDTLRTKEQLGYTVFSGSTSLGDGAITAVYITVQGQVASVSHLQARIEAFVVAYRAELEALSEEAFEARKAVLFHRLTEPNKTQGEAHGRLRAPIDGGRYAWGGAEAAAAAVRAAQLHDLKRLYDEALLPGSRLQRKFVSRVYAQAGSSGTPSPPSGSPVHDGGPSSVPALTPFEAPPSPAAFQACVAMPPSFASPPREGGEAGVWAPTLEELPTALASVTTSLQKSYQCVLRTHVAPAPQPWQTPANDCRASCGITRTQRKGLIQQL